MNAHACHSRHLAVWGADVAAMAGFSSVTIQVTRADQLSLVDNTMLAALRVMAALRVPWCRAKTMLTGLAMHGMLGSRRICSHQVLHIDAGLRQISWHVVLWPQVTITLRDGSSFELRCATDHPAASRILADHLNHLMLSTVAAAASGHGEGSKR